MELIEYSINNWEKYNPRTDRKNYTWFRMENNFFTDPCTFSLDAKQKLMLIYLFCEASKKGKAKSILNLTMAANITGCSEKEVGKALQVIESLGFISICHPKDAKRRQKTPKDGLRTYERTNERTNRAAAFSSDIKTIIEFFNDATGKKYKPNSKEASKLITQLLKDSFSIDDFKYVITVKNEQWKDDPKMSQFIRPSTLFRRAKFEEYLNDKSEAQQQNEVEKKLGEFFQVDKI